MEQVTGSRGGKRVTKKTPLNDNQISKGEGVKLKKNGTWKKKRGLCKLGLRE